VRGSGRQRNDWKLDDEHSDVMEAMRLGLIPTPTLDPVVKKFVSEVNR
jgi:hypothetical protein